MSVLAISALVIDTSKNVLKDILNRVLCIYYLMKFQKDKAENIWALIDSNNEVNVMISAYAKKLGLNMQKTDVGIHKIDSLLLKTFGIVIAGFQVIDKLGKAQFF